MTLTPSSSAADVIALLKTLRSEENIAGMARFGIVTDHALGISNPDLRRIAKAIRRDHVRALALWGSGIREAQLLASFTARLNELTPHQARAIAVEFNSWEMVDAWADTFAAAGLGPELIEEFASDDREFVRRAAFAMIAWSAVHLKAAPDDFFLGFLPLIETHACDRRNFVRKAVNWALRQIGKRNAVCHAAALDVAARLASSPDATARWIGKDAVRELTGAIARRKAGLAP